MAEEEARLLPPRIIRAQAAETPSPMAMKNRGFDAFTDFVIAGAGGCAFALAASFGWRGKDAPHVLGLHSALLALVGLGLLVASVAIRRSAGRIAFLEDQLAALKRTNG